MSPVLHRPETVGEACALLAADSSAMAFGGGTAIQILRKQGILFAEAFVDLSRIPGLSDITPTPGGLRAGPMVTIRRMETTMLVREVAPLAATAYGKVANPRVRNTASIGGNVAHGDYRLDPPVALLALGGTIEATSSAGARQITAADFFVDFQQTALRPGELVTAIEIPAMPAGAAASYAKLSSLSANDWPCASAAALLAPEGGRLTLRLSIGALAPIPRLSSADVTGRGEEEVVGIALEIAETLMDPIPDVRGSVEYKRTLGRVAVEDAVRDAWKSSQEVASLVRKEKRVTDLIGSDPDGAGGAVGQRWRRADAEAKVRGTFRYTADEPVGRVCYVGVHRASRPHARILAVETEAARAVPGVAAVVTGADLYRSLGDRLLSGPAFSDQPALACDRVRYAGEPVAAVLAWDLNTARAAADEVYVEYEDLQPVHNVDDAVAGGPFVHSELRPSSVFGDLAHLSGRTETNINYEYNLRRGHVDAATKAAATTVRGEFWSPPTHHVPIELPCTTAWPAGDRLEILSTTQTPSYVRQAISELLDLRLNQVRVRTRPLGGSFGSKMYDRLEPLVAALAWLLRMPVRMEATREDAFLLTTRHGVAVTGHMSADAEGNIVAAAADVRYDTGAYADIGPRIAAKSGMVACGPYRLDNAWVRSRCVYTNKPSAGPYRGFGVPQVTIAHETLVDELARARGEDPAAYRRRNLLREGDTAVMGTVMHSADFVGCLDAATAAIGWDEPLRREEGSWRWGRGVAVGMKAVLTPTISNAVLQLNQDATASLLISTVDMGQGSDTIMAQIAAEVLCLGPGQVRVVAADTDVTPYDTITAGSRSTYHTGNAVRMAAERMRDRLISLGAKRLGVSATDCKLTAGGVASGSEQRSVSLPELIHGHFGARGTTLTTEANFTTQWVPYDHDTGQSPNVTEHWFAGAVAVEIGVDTRTGRIRIRHVALAADVGRAVNPTMVEQQLIGSAIMGTGQALFDYIVFDEGQMLNGTLLDYQLPSIKDVPDKITPIIVESPHRTGPFGAKGVGETVLIPFSPAIANGVRDAVGVRITTLPLTPERVLAAIRDRKAA